MCFKNMLYLFVGGLDGFLSSLCRGVGLGPHGLRLFNLCGKLCFNRFSRLAEIIETVIIWNILRLDFPDLLKLNVDDLKIF